MNYTQQEATEQNCKVLAGLRDLFQLLDEHEAIIGRNSARIVVDLSKAPTIMRDEIGEIFRTSQLASPNGTMGIFGSFQTDDETGILLLNIGIAFTDGNAVFAKFPGYNEVQSLLQSIPALTTEQNEAIEALHEQLEADFLGLLVQHREAIFEGLFSGSDSPNWTYHDPKDKTLN